MEGVCIQTHAVLRQAWEEKASGVGCAAVFVCLWLLAAWASAPCDSWLPGHLLLLAALLAAASEAQHTPHRPHTRTLKHWCQVKLCLVVNKVDRLILELRLTPGEAYERLRAIIAHANMIVSSFRSEQYISGESACGTAGTAGTLAHSGLWAMRRGLAALGGAPVPEACNPAPCSAHTHTHPPPHTHLLTSTSSTEADAVLAYEEAKADQGAAARHADGGADADTEAEAAGRGGEAAEEEDEQAFSPERGNVAFGSAHDGWAFRIDQFAELYAGACWRALAPFGVGACLRWCSLETQAQVLQLSGGIGRHAPRRPGLVTPRPLPLAPSLHPPAAKMGCKAGALQRALWGDFAYQAKTKRIVRIKNDQIGRLKPLFVQLALEPIWKVGG